MWVELETVKLSTLDQPDAGLKELLPMKSVNYLVLCLFIRFFLLLLLFSLCFKFIVLSARGVYWLLLVLFFLYIFPFFLLRSVFIFICIYFRNVISYKRLRTSSTDISKDLAKF